MLVKWLRENNVSAALFAVLRIFLGYQWMTAGFHKITDGFDASGYLNGAVANPVKGPDGIVYGGWVTFLENFAIPNADLFNVLVPWGEFLVGLGLILGCLTTAAAFFGVVMNFSFMLSGTVSHNPTDIIMGVLIMVAGYNAGKYGLDRYVIPFISKKWKKEEKDKQLSI
jgi:thiosulfate dehydrogenase (quinone) large subunit